jgi:hypothetical protein
MTRPVDFVDPFIAHHDFTGPTALHGGPDSFVRHLDRFFETG